MSSVLLCMRCRRPRLVQDGNDYCHSCAVSILSPVAPAVATPPPEAEALACAVEDWHKGKKDTGDAYQDTIDRVRDYRAKYPRQPCDE